MHKTDICRCCGFHAGFIRTGSLLDLTIRYYECNRCGYVQTQFPHWLERAYLNAINQSDTGILVRNQLNARIVLGTLHLLGKLKGNIVDCAGGYGILVRLLRDYGVNALWSDPMCKNLVAQGFEHRNEMADLATAFEAFEHFLNPAEELDKLLEIAPNILFSTEIISDPTPDERWWYYGREHGQHIGFFRIRTLEKLARERGKYLLSNGTSYHLIASQKINKTVWMAAIKANRFVPWLLRRRLKSKTWADHKHISLQVK